MKVTKDTPKGTYVEIKRGPYKGRIGAIIHNHENHSYVSDMTFGLTFPHSDLKLSPTSPVEVFIDIDPHHFRGYDPKTNSHVFGYYYPGTIVTPAGDHIEIIPGSQSISSGFRCEETKAYIYVGDVVDSWCEMDGTDDDGKTWFKTGKIVRKYNQVVDFQDSKFLVPHYIGPLSSILKQKLANGTSVIIANESTYLSTIKFPFGVHNQKGQPFSLEYYTDKTYIPIIHFPTALTIDEATLREHILSTINSLLKQQLQLPINVLMGFYYMIDELTQNIVDHSDESFGTIFAQFYRDKNYMDLCICDCGKGLFQSYLDSGKHDPKTNAEAINFGVYGKSTKNIAESRGFGLNTSRNMLTKGLKGKFFMMTGNDFFIQTLEREEIIGLPAQFEFNGCMLSLRIPIFNSENFTIHSYTDL